MRRRDPSGHAAGQPGPRHRHRRPARAAPGRAPGGGRGTALCLPRTGFFPVTKHGIAPAITDNLFAAIRALFALPDAVKQALSIRRAPLDRGTVGLSEEQLDPDKPADRKEGFNIGLDLSADEPDILAGLPFRGVNLWPEGAPHLRSAIMAHFDAARGARLHVASRLCARSRNRGKFLRGQAGSPAGHLAPAHYPAGGGADAALGAGEHTDCGNVTVLAADGVAGLEVKHRSLGWQTVPQIPGAFVCNIDDCLMRWTNDACFPTPHRVRVPAAERYSAAFFLDPNPDTLVTVLPACTSPGEPAKYPPVTGAEYPRQKLDATCAHRRSPFT